MSILRPGGLELTRYALNAAHVKPGGALLDVGCGDGTAAAMAREEFGLMVTAIDKDEISVAAAKEKGVNARIMDAAALDFSSRCFDAVMMECVFSALERQEEALHEAYCVLRPGGTLIISDVYCRRPDMERWRQEYSETMARFRLTRREGECENQQTLPPSICQDGALVLDGLQMLLDELELETVLFEDRTEDLKTFLGQAIFDHGSIKAWLQTQGDRACCACTGENTGYFLLIARKKDA